MVSYQAMFSIYVQETFSFFKKRNNGAVDVGEQGLGEVEGRENWSECIV